VASISAVILYEYGVVREGLLFVSCGAYNVLSRPGSLPVFMDSMVAVVVEMPFDELDEGHRLEVVVRDVATADERGRADATLSGGHGSVHSSSVGPGAPAHVPFVFDLRGVDLANYGPHDVSVSLDGEVATLLTFYVRPSP
jgi:Family of unknown function (DUF6941)